MFSKCGAQLLRTCRIQHAGILLRSKTATKIDFTLRTYSRTAYNSSSKDDGNKIPPTDNSSDDEYVSDKDDEDSDDESVFGDLNRPSDGIDAAKVLTPEEEDAALEARTLWYARKVAGIVDEKVVPVELPYQPLREQKIDELGRSYGTGKRKTSVARVWIKEGSGIFVVNDRKLIDYFEPISREACLGAFVASDTAGLFDVWCTVKGGGSTGQSGAIRLGIARALEAYDPNYREALAPAGMLSRDSRRVERKKPGQKKARKQFQWVKR